MLNSASREDLCKLNRVASQPHIQALSPAVADKENHNHHQRSSSIPIKKNNNNMISPIPSPSDFGTSIPRSFERPKSIILTMDAIKNKNSRLPEPVELSLLSSDKQTDNEDNENKDHFEDISSGKLFVTLINNEYTNQLF